MPWERKMTDEGVDFIVWAKKNNWSNVDIAQYLKEHGDVDVTTNTVRRTYDKNKHKDIRYNPYDYDPESDVMIEDEENYENDSDNEPDNEVLKKDESNIDSQIIYDETDEVSFFAAADLEDKLKNAQLKPAKIKQIKETFENTDGTADDLLWVLDVAGVSPPITRQIIANTFGKRTVERIWPSSRINNSRINNGKEVQTKQSPPGITVSKIMDEALSAKKKEYDLKHINEMLSSLDTKKGEDPLRLVKEIYALKALKIDEEKKPNNDMVEKILLQKVLKDDNSLVNSIKVLNELKQDNNGKDANMLGFMIEEMRDLRKQAQEQQTISVQSMMDSQVQKMSVYERMQEMQQKTLEKMNEISLAQMKEKADAEQRLLEELRKSEIKSMQIQMEHAKKQYEQSTHSEEDLLSNLLQKGEILQQMGLMVPADKVKGDSEQQVAIARLNTMKDVAQTVPGEIRRAISESVSEGITQINNMMMQYMEFQLKREQAAFNIQQKQLEMQSQRQTMSPLYPPRTPEERLHLMRNLEGVVDNVERNKRYQERFQEIDNNET